MNLPPLPKFDEWIAQAYREPHERFTKYNMEVAYQAGRKQALEEAAKVCDNISINHLNTYKHNPGPNAYDPHFQGLSMGAGECADEIRELK